MQDDIAVPRELPSTADDVNGRRRHGAAARCVCTWRHATARRGDDARATDSASASAIVVNAGDEEDADGSEHRALAALGERV